MLYRCPGRLIRDLVLAAGMCLHGAADNLHVILDDRLSRPSSYTSVIIARKSLLSL